MEPLSWSFSPSGPLVPCPRPHTLSHPTPARPSAVREDCIDLTGMSNWVLGEGPMTLPALSLMWECQQSTSPAVMSFCKQAQQNS